jgi:hypothetical protein
MKIFLLISIIVFVFCFKSQGQNDTVIINGIKFLTVTKSVLNEYDGKDTVMEIYRIQNRVSKYLLKHYLYRYGADCNNEFTDKGAYAIQHDSLIFITKYFQKTGLDPIPKKRKQIYKVRIDGKLIKIYDKQQEAVTNKWTDTENRDEP